MIFALLVLALVILAVGGGAAYLAHLRIGPKASGGVAILVVMVLVMLFVFSRAVVASV